MSSCGKKLPLLDSGDRSVRMKRQLIDRREMEEEREITFYHRILFHELKSFGEKRRRAGGFIDGISFSRRTFEESSRDSASQWTEGGTDDEGWNKTSGARVYAHFKRVSEKEKEKADRKIGEESVARAREEIDGR